MQRVLYHHAGLTESAAALVLISAFGNGPNLLPRISQPLEKHPISKYLEALKLAALQEPLQRCADTQCAALLESSERPGNCREKRRKLRKQRVLFLHVHTLRPWPLRYPLVCRKLAQCYLQKGQRLGVSPGMTWKWEDCAPSGGGR